VAVGAIPAACAAPGESGSEGTTSLGVGTRSETADLGRAARSLRTPNSISCSCEERPNRCYERIRREDEREVVAGNVLEAPESELVGKTSDAAVGGVLLFGAEQEKRRDGDRGEDVPVER
jgi:hypothetical protein